MFAKELFLSRCSYGASICTSAAADAFISVDNVLAVAFGNARGGAAVCTSATADALIGNLVCHWYVLHKNFVATYILAHL